MEKREKYGGRKKGSVNKTTAEIRTAAKEFAGEALEILVKHMRNTEAASSSMAAAREILDRAYGKNLQQTQSLNPEGQVKEEISNLELARWVAHLLTKGIDPTPEPEEEKVTH